MGGSKGETISGLRLHISGGDVHVHDDSKNLKFNVESNEFRVECETGLDYLNELKDDGLYEITGVGRNTFCLLKSGKIISMFVKDGNGIKQKLQRFLKNC